MEKHRGRIEDQSCLGTTTHRADLGFFCHPGIVVNPADASLSGIIDILLWHREEDQKDKKGRDYQSLPMDEKESNRWPERAIASRRRLEAVEKVTVVQDREGDIYESFCRLKAGGVDYVIRSSKDRRVSGGKLHESTDKFDVSGAFTIKITTDNKKRQIREAQMGIRYGEIALCRPRNIVESEKYPSTFPVRVVHAKEKPESVSAGETPVEWLLYTSHPVNSPAQAQEIIYYYKLRWQIEDLFRTLKKEGVNYEASELESGKALRKLLVMALMAAVQILQLRQARDGKTQQEASLVFSDEQLACMEDILPRFEGKTEKQ